MLKQSETTEAFILNIHPFDHLLLILSSMYAKVFRSEPHPQEKNKGKEKNKKQ